MKLMICMLIVCMLLAAAVACAETYDVPLPHEVESESNVIDLTPVINAALALLGEILMAVIAVVILPPLKAWMQARMSKAQQEKAIELIRQLVLAAEQVLGRGCGSEKMDYVIKGLEDRGYMIDVDLIEAAVKQMNDNAMGYLASEVQERIYPPDDEI